MERPKNDHAFDYGAAMTTDDDMPDFPPGYEQMAAVAANGSNGLEPGGLPSSVKPTPEQLDWARRHFNEGEVVAALRDLRENGGFQLADILPELKRLAGIDD
jgi:hypothetical protein